MSNNKSTCTCDTHVHIFKGTVPLWKDLPHLMFLAGRAWHQHTDVDTNRKGITSSNFFGFPPDMRMPKVFHARVKNSSQTCKLDGFGNFPRRRIHWLQLHQADIEGIKGGSF